MESSATSIRGGRTMVLCCAHALRCDGLELFVRSLRQTGYTDRVCVLVSQMGDEEKALMRRYDVELIPFQAAYLPARSRYFLDLAVLLSSPREFRRKRRELAVSWIPIVSSRYLQFFSLLREWAQDCDQVVMLDCRDTIFQGNPALLPFGDQVTVVEEVAHKTVGNCPWNSKVIRKAYGEAGLRELAQRPVICCGAIFGRREPLIPFLERYGDEIARFATSEFFDQAALNHLVFKDPGFAQVLPDVNPAVLHMNSMAPGEFGVREDGVILNRDGQAPVIVHQYDRHPALHEQLREKIRSGL